MKAKNSTKNRYYFFPGHNLAEIIIFAMTFRSRIGNIPLNSNPAL